MFSEYDKIGLKSKILKYIIKIISIVLIMNNSQLHERVSSTKKELHTSPHED